MCSERYGRLKESLEDFDKSWEEELLRLRQDIKKAEKKILLNKQGRFADKTSLIKGCSKSDDSLIAVDVYSSPMVDRVSSGGRLEAKDLRMAKDRGDWVSPTVSKTRFDPFADRLDSSFEIDCGSSVISLDFGLVSPNKNWCSPPQRIERAQNREWSSPHRVIDRPNPENSPGNWISMKESTAKRSPALGFQSQPVEVSKFVCPLPEPSPLSECTYVLPEVAKESQAREDLPKRKTSILDDYEPERVVSTTTKKRAGGPTDAIEISLLPTNDKVRRVVDPSGHVIKISHLDDYEAPVFGKTHDKGEGAEKEAGEPADKSTRGSTCKITKISSKLSPAVLKSKKRKEEPKEEGGAGIRIQSVDEVQETDKAKPGEEEEKKAEDVSKSTQKMIRDLEEILRTPNTGEVSPSKEKAKEQRSKSVRKIKPKAAVSEEKTLQVAVEKRKRNVDPKAVQEYIKSQKQKRIEQVKTEKKTKDAEREARKKKLEELRIKTLKLAAQSKRKKSTPPAIRAADPGTEDDVTMSLGLKQTKPKISYNESVLKLKKKATQPKPESQPIEQPEKEEETEEKTLENLETIRIVEELTKPEDTVELRARKDLNDTLKKLAETLHLKIDQQEKQLRSRPGSVASKSAKDPLSQVSSTETLRSVKSSPENRQMVTVDLETIQTLKSDIKKISDNFKTLHEIIVDKADLFGKVVEMEKQQTVRKVTESPRQEIPDWMSRTLPRAYPCNVFSAFQRKLNLKTTQTPSTVSRGSSTFAEPISNKYESEFEALSMPSDRLRSVKETVPSKTSEENYYSMKEDSGSEFSSSILDSEKQSLTSAEKILSLSRGTGSKDSLTSSIITEISSRSIQLATSKGFDSTDSKSYYSKLSSERENLILVTPDLKLISNDLHEEKLNNYTKNLNVLKQGELNNSEKSSKEQKTDSTITELIDNLSENDKSVKSTNEKPQNVIQRIEEVHVRRSFFQPEMLHLQFQAELTLLEKFQQSLSQFLEAERMKTLTEVSKIVSEKAINTEKPIQREEQSVQTSYLKENLDKTSDETDSVKTEINVEEESEIRTEKLDLSVSESSEKPSSSSKETLRETQQKDPETSDVSNSHAGISFQMLNRMMKDEELRSEHQLALIRLREKTLNEKVKAELTFLEMKKRALKERSGDEEQNISAIKKKQRGILLKYQSEKEEIERLKKMHKIASEERKIMIKQQKQIQQMQMSTNDMIIKLKRREKSPQKKSPLKLKALKSSESQSEVPEDIPIVSDSILTESVYSDSSQTDFEVSSRSNVSEDEILRRNAKTLRAKLTHSLETLKPKKCQLELEKHPRKRHSVEELLTWTKRLEEKENRLKELEKQTMNAANKAKTKLTKSYVKTSMKDRSTSPFQFQDVKSTSEVSPTEVTEPKKSSTISEAIETHPQTEVTEKTESVVEKIQSSASEDIPEQFSKKMSASRTEYYSESFESPSSSEATKTKPEITRTKPDWGHKGIAIKLSLSPRMQSPRRRYSSGSDDSVNLSHTETASEQSDLESRIAALHEQLRKRKLEAERLRREQKKAQRERLKVKEQSLLKQIQAYDAYIQKKKQELEQEYENSTQTFMKPLIKQPKVAEMSPLKRQELMMQETDKLSFHPRLSTKTKEKEENIQSEKTGDKESDSEVTEQIKQTSESVVEPTEESESIKEVSKLEEEESSKPTGSIPEVENLTKDSAKSSSASESLQEAETLEGSQSESEDQSASVKTTLHSPEKPETEILESPTGVTEESPKETIDEDVYQFDSFESDAEEKATTESENVQKTLESSAEIQTESVGETIEGTTAEEETEEAEEGKTEKVEKVADSILMGLILESLNVFCSKKAEAEKKLAEKSKLSLETLSGFLAREIISEAVDDMIRIYNKKDEKGASDRISPEIRKRIGEMASPANKETPEDEKLDRSPPSRLEKKLEVVTELGHNEETKNETFGQEWTDDDFGLSQTRREAEELRLQQLQIEQEIQQLQAQQEVPYFYLREIPNKPPPPYTPPGKPLAEIPTSESDIMNITGNAVRIVMEEMQKGKDVGEVEPPRDFYGDAVGEHLKCYKFFLFDLAKHVIWELTKRQEKKAEVLPWLKTREQLSAYKYRKIERSLECVSEFVKSQVAVMFGFGKRVSKESLIVRWIKKKRDHVDEILVAESQEEEDQWTRYDEDQVAVKNEVALAILDGLLEDTARVFDGIVSSKMKKGKPK